MARRMFNSAIVSSDPFLEMPSSTQALYFHLGMNADDEGFVYPRSIMRGLGAADDDLKILVAKKFVLPFESGVVVMKHWHVNNTIRYDRRLATTHTKERGLLNLDTSGVYREIDNQHAALMQHEGRISKEVSKEVKKEISPSKERKPRSIKDMKPNFLKN